MESQMFDDVKLEKEKAMARFNCFRRISKLRQFFEVFIVLGLISWSSARAPPLLRAAATFAVEFSTYLLNYHVVFIIGNAIIASLFLLCRHNNDADALSAGGGDELCSEYNMHSEAATAAEFNRRNSADLPPTGGSGEEVEEEKRVITAEIPQCDEVAAAIEKATRQIKRFERTRSVRLKREIRAALRRSETENRRKSVSVAAEIDIERLSSEEFRRTVDDFIDKHWRGKKTKQKYPLLNMA